MVNDVHQIVFFQAMKTNRSVLAGKKSISSYRFMSTQFVRMLRDTSRKA